MLKTKYSPLTVSVYEVFMVSHFITILRNGYTSGNLTATSMFLLLYKYKPIIYGFWIAYWKVLVFSLLNVCL